MNTRLDRTVIGLAIRYAAALTLCGGVVAAQQPSPTKPLPKTAARSLPRLAVDLSAAKLDSSARSTPSGRCGQNIVNALMAGGLDISGKVRDLHAKNYGPVLESSGFKQVPAEGYVPKQGDVVILQPYPGGPPSGHIAMYTGKQWVSDYKQADFYAGSAYRNSGAHYVFYRHANAGVAEAPSSGSTGIQPRGATPDGTKPRDVATTQPNEQPQPKDEQTEKLERRAKELAAKGVKPPEKTPGDKVGEEKVVIPQDCVIELVTWSEKAPGQATTTLHVRGGKVTASAPDYVQPAENNESYSRTSQRFTFRFSGGVQGNTIVGEWLQTRTPIEAKGWSAKGLEFHYREHQTYRSALQIVLNADGTATWSNKSNWTWKYEIFVGGPYTDGAGAAEDSGVGVWHFRKSEPNAASARPE